MRPARLHPSSCPARNRVRSHARGAVAPPPARNRRRRGDRRACRRVPAGSRSGAAGGAARRADPAQGRHDRQRRSGGRRSREGRRADRRREDRRGRAQPGRVGRRDDRCGQHDRHAGLRRHAPPHVGGPASQHHPRRDAARISPHHAGRVWQHVPAGRRLYRRPGQRVVGARCRRDHPARLVAHPEHAGAYRRGDPRPQGIRRARRVRLRLPRAARQALVGGEGRPRLPRRHQAAAHAVFQLQTTSF